MTNQCLYFHIFVCFIHPPLDTHMEPYKKPLLKTATGGDG